MVRTRLLNKYKKDKSEVNRKAYKRQRNICVNLLKKTKFSYFQNIKPSLICDNKRFWLVVKPLFSDKKLQTTSNTITLIENNDIISDDQKLAQIFNNFFSNAVKDLNIPYVKPFASKSSSITHSYPVTNAIFKYKHHPSILKIKNNIKENDNFSFQATNLMFVNREIEKLDSSKATSCESLTAKVNKDLKIILSPVIVYYFNEFVETGIFPSNLKIADVSPVFKKNAKECKEN